VQTTFRPYQPDQLFLLPPTPRDWLPEGHLAYFIAETVDRMDLRCFYSRYGGDGRRNCPFDPRMMVKILLYGYATPEDVGQKVVPLSFLLKADGELTGIFRTRAKARNPLC